MKKLTFLTIVIAAVISYSCKKDRVELPEDLNEYVPVNTYLDSKKQQEQEFIIAGPSNDTIVGNQGTRILGDKNCLINSGGGTITYPYTIKLVELYTPKDMIYAQMPTVAGGKLLESAGEIRLRAFKGGQELMLAPNCPYQVEMPNANPVTTMSIYYGTDNGTFVDWFNSFVPFSTITGHYKGFVNRLGWINADNEIGNGTGHSLNFTSSTDDLTNVGIFIYFPAINGLMQVYSVNSGAIPNNSNVKIVMIAVNSSGQLFSYTENRTVNSSAAIDVVLSPTTDPLLTVLLNSL